MIYLRKKPLNRWSFSIKLVPGTGIEPVRSVNPQDFKSCASTYFATWALIGHSLEIRTPDPLIKSQVLYRLS